MNKDYFPNQFFQDLDLFLQAPSSHELNILTSHDFDPKDPLNRLKMVTIDRREDFCIFLSFYILLDQILFTYDKENYREFEEKYRIPKLEFCGHGKVTSYPFSIFTYHKVSLEQFSSNFKIFYERFVGKNLTENQIELFVKMITNDNALDNDIYGKALKSITELTK